MRRSVLICLVVSFTYLTAAAETADKPAAVPKVGTLIHDLRDFLPEAESKTGNADDPIPAFSVKDDGYWKSYRTYSKNGTGYLSRTEISALVADLKKSLRENYPEVFAAIDTDGDEAITLAEFNAYLKKPR